MPIYFTSCLTIFGVIAMDDEIIANAYVLFFVVIPLIALLIPLLFLVVAAVRRALKDIYELFWQD